MHFGRLRRFWRELRQNRSNPRRCVDISGGVSGEGVGGRAISNYSLVGRVEREKRGRVGKRFNSDSAYIRPLRISHLSSNFAAIP